jgi:hypothetical protein
MCVFRFLGFVCVMLFLMGIGDLYTAMTQRKLEVVNISDVTDTVPGSKWIRIEKGQFDFVRASSIRIRGLNKSQYVYAPLVLNTSTQSDSLKVIVKTTNKEWLDLHDEWLRIKGERDKEDAYVSKHMGMMQSFRTFEGLARRGISSGSSDEYSLLKKSYPYIDENVVILEDGERPSFAKGLKKIGVAIFGTLLIGAVSLWRERSQKKASPPPLPKPPLSPPPLPS